MEISLQNPLKGRLLKPSLGLRRLWLALNCTKRYVGEQCKKRSELQKVVRYSVIFGTQVETRGEDEVGTLAEVFNFPGLPKRQILTASNAGN